jgi:urease beta subunit
VIPGEWLLSDEAIEINVGRRKGRISVRNTGDRAIQVGSHFHFFEANGALEFDRNATVGMRLDVPAGQSIRFEAGDERDVNLVEFGGIGRVIGFNSLLDGAISAPLTVQRALRRVERLGLAGGEAMQGSRNGEPRRRSEREVRVRRDEIVLPSGSSE